jgi:DNA-binding LacI/PurR family transcriptional regulator
MKLEDVADKAKVCVASVSRALNGRGQLRRSIRSHVVKVVREPNRYSHLLARSLAKRESQG